MRAHTHRCTHSPLCDLKSRLNQAGSLEIPISPNAGSIFTFKEEAGKDTGGKKSVFQFSAIVSVAKLIGGKQACIKLSSYRVFILILCVDLLGPIIKLQGDKVYFINYSQITQTVKVKAVPDKC